MSLKQTLNDWASIIQAKPKGFKYNGLMAMVAGEGKELSQVPFTPSEVAFVKRLINAPEDFTTVKECYRNAAQMVWYALALRHGHTVEYGEGYGLDPTLGIPLEHAVLVLNGKAVDLTWGSRVEPDDLLARAKHCQQNNEYHMVTFTPQEMSKRLNETGVYGLLEWNKELVKHGKPALTSMVKKS